jgi:hypothetical protein
MTAITSTQNTSPNAISVTGFFADTDFDFLTRMVIGYAAQGVFDVGPEPVKPDETSGCLGGLW